MLTLSYSLRPLIRYGLVASTLGLVLAMPAYAGSADKNSRERQALQRAQQALRDLQTEKDAWQNQQSQLTSQKQQLEGENARLSSSLEKLTNVQTQWRATQARVNELESLNRKQQAQINADQTQQLELQQQLKEAQTRLAAVLKRLATSTQNQQVLEERNRQLYDISLTAVELYRSKSALETWSQKASPLGLSGVKIENAAEEMKTKIENARYATHDTASSAKPADCP